MTRRFLGIVLLLPALLTACAKVVNYTHSENPQYFENRQDMPSRTGDTLTIVTYNIEYASKIDEAIVDLRHSEDIQHADLILLQEMDHDGVARIAAHLGYNYVYYPAAKRPETDRDFGNAILSKWPLTEPAKIILPHLKPVRDMQRLAVFASATIGRRRILCSSVHIEMFLMGRDRRIEQVDSLSSSIPPGEPFVIVGGDFNSMLNSTLTVFDSLMAEAGLFRGTVGNDWTAAFGLLGLLKFKLDHVYLKGFKVIDKGVVYDTRGSDHKPVWVKVVWDERIANHQTQ